MIGQRFDVDLADAATGQDVVELMQQDRPPAVEQVAHGDLVAEAGCDGGVDLGLAIAQLVLTIGLLGCAVGRVGPAVCFEVQLAVPDGQVLCLSRRLGQVLLGTVLPTARQAGECLGALSVFEIRRRRPAATIAMAERHEHFVVFGLLQVVAP